MSIPADFELPVSSFAEYGGHSSIEVRFDAKSTTSYYDGSTMGGNNIAYLQGKTYFSPQSDWSLTKWFLQLEFLATEFLKCE